jgi:hypothetical protein
LQGQGQGQGQGRGQRQVQDKDKDKDKDNGKGKGKGTGKLGRYGKRLKGKGWMGGKGLEAEKGKLKDERRIAYFTLRITYVWLVYETPSLHLLSNFHFIARLRDA